MSTQKKIDYLQQIIEEITKFIASVDKSGLEVSRLKEFQDFRTSLIHESDRGSVLMAAAFIEDKLTCLLESYFIENKKVCKQLLKGNGALATFSSKIDLTFLLGLISKNIFNDLHILRKIRNDFAHTASNISFETPSIRDRTKALSTLSKEMLKDNTKAYFMRSMTTILTAINMKMENFERCSTPENFDMDIFDKSFKIIEDGLSEYMS
jgi:DNA-binding MltR family transcriptional regulator